MLNYERIDGSIVFTRDNGERIGRIEWRDPIRSDLDGYWLTRMELKGASLDCMPCRSLEAAKYLMLAATLEWDADPKNAAK